MVYRTVLVRSFSTRITFFRVASSLMLRTALRLPAGSIVCQPAKMQNLMVSHPHIGQQVKGRVSTRGQRKPTADTWSLRLDIGPLTHFFLSKYDLYSMHIQILVRQKSEGGLLPHKTSVVAIDQYKVRNSVWAIKVTLFILSTEACVYLWPRLSKSRHTILHT